MEKFPNLTGLSITLTLIDYLKTVEDYRALRGRRYPLWLIQKTACEAPLCFRLSLSKEEIPKGSIHKTQIVVHFFIAIQFLLFFLT